MDAEELYRVLKHQPFHPIRLHLSDGSHYDIKHPDQAIVSKRSMHIGLTGNGDRPYQKVAVVANIHINRIEPLEPRRATG